MESIARRSVLNPLATCFVPASMMFPEKVEGLKIAVEDKTVIKPEPAKLLETAEETCAVNLPKNNLIVSEILVESYSNEAEMADTEETPMNFMGTKLERAMRLDATLLLLIWIDFYYGSFLKLDGFFGKIKRKFYESEWLSTLTVVRIVRYLNRMVNSNKLEEPTKEPVTDIRDEKTKVSEKKTENLMEQKYQQEEKDDVEECDCPPMFGWIAPFDFFGNPLKLPNSCKKNFSHMSGSCKHSDIKSDLSTSDLYSLELKAIIKDVFDSVDNSLSLCDDDENVDETEVSYKKLSRPVWNDVIVTDVPAKELIDDGDHPLLRDTSLMENESEVEISKIKQILGECLSPSNKIRNNCITPCTVWCKQVPTSAKDLYRKFIRQLNEPELKQHGDSTNELNWTNSKPVYKRSFSSDDAPQYLKSQRIVKSTSDAELKESLNLLRRYPEAFIMLSGGVSSKSGNRFKSQSDLRSYSKELCLNGDSLKWGPFDGDDSLWQPLPDCVPSSAQKHRVREVKRQKSM